MQKVGQEMAMRDLEESEHVPVDDDEPSMPSMPEGVEPTYESIDLPIQTSAAMAIGQGLKKAQAQFNVSREEQKSTTTDTSK